MLDVLQLTLKKKSLILLLHRMSVSAEGRLAGILQVTGSESEQVYLGKFRNIGRTEVYQTNGPEKICQMILF